MKPGQREKGDLRPMSPGGFSIVSERRIWAECEEGEMKMRLSTLLTTLLPRY